MVAKIYHSKVKYSVLKLIFLKNMDLRFEIIEFQKAKGKVV